MMQTTIISRSLICRCIALPLLLLLLSVERAEALSAALYASSSGNADCSGLAFRSASNLDSGVCFSIGDFGARITCAADGTVSQAALYQSRSCDIVYISGRGGGDGLSCITLSSPRSSVVWSTIIDCSAPGSGSKAGPSSGTIAGAVIGSIVGVALLVGLVWWCYSRHKQTQAKQQVAPPAQASIYLQSTPQPFGVVPNQQQQQQQFYQPQPQQQQPASHHIPPHNYSSGVAPGTMMAIVCCLALAMLLQPVNASGSDGVFFFNTGNCTGKPSYIEPFTVGACMIFDTRDARSFKVSSHTR